MGVLTLLFEDDDEEAGGGRAGFGLCSLLGVPATGVDGFEELGETSLLDDGRGGRDGGGF